MNIKNKILLLFVFLCSVCCILNIGKHIEPPFTSSIHPNTSNFLPSDKYKQSNLTFKENIGGVVLDNYSTTCIYLNKNKEVVNIKDADPVGNQCSFVDWSVICNNNIYFGYIELNEDNGIYTKFKIVKTSLNGKNEKIIWEHNYTSKEASASSPGFYYLNILNQNDCFYLLESYDDENYMNIYCVDKDKVNFLHKIEKNAYFKFYTATYNEKINALGIMDENSNARIYLNNQEFKTINNIENKINYVYLDDNKDVVKYENINIQKENIDKLNFSIPYLMKTNFLWFSILFLLILILWKIYNNLKNNIKKKKYEKLRVLLLIVGAIAVAFWIAIVYTWKLYDLSFLYVRSITNNLLLNTKDSEIIDACNFTKESEIEYYENFLKELRDNSVTSNIRLDYTYIKYVKNEDNENVEPYVLSSTLSNTKNGQKINLNDLDHLNTNNNISLYTYSNWKEFYIIGIKDIVRDNQKICGALLSIDASYYYSYLMSYAYTNFIEIFITIIIVILSLLEIIGFIKSIHLKHKFIKLKVKSPELAFTRTFSFLSYYLTTFDSVLVVLIAKDIVQSLGNNDLTVLYAVPISLLSFGRFLGIFVFNRLSKIVNINILTIICSFFSIIVFIAMFFIVKLGNIWAFSLLNLASGITTGTIFTIRSYMPILAGKEDKLRLFSNKEIALSGISSSVISVAISGGIGSMLGNEFIYLFAIVPTILIILFGIFVFPKGVKYINKQRSYKIAPKKMIKFIFNPTFIVFIVFLVMADNFCSGYKSYIFPVLSSEANISNVQVSNYVVIASFISFFTSSLFDKITKKVDYTTLSTLIIITTGIVFLSLVFNDTVVWSILIIVVMSTLSRIDSISYNMLWPKLCKNLNFSEDACNSIILYSINFFYAIRNMVMGFLLCFGSNTACFIFAFFLIGGGLIFYIVSKKTKLFN